MVLGRQPVYGISVRQYGHATRPRTQSLRIIVHIESNLHHADRSTLSSPIPFHIENKSQHLRFQAWAVPSLVTVPKFPGEPPHERSRRCSR